jgi:transcription initiation factor TFIIIB Brf1 subunit/transcription initiation factor TFIIB
MSTNDKKDSRRTATGVAAAAVVVAAALAGASGIVTAVPNVAGVRLDELKSLEDTVLGNALTRNSDADTVEIAAGWNA